MSIQHFSFDYRVLPSNCGLILAVSGGTDSTFLAHSINALKDKFNLAPVIAHVNYNLRGADSLADELFTRQLATKLSLPYYVRHVTTDLRLSGNLQSAARAVRQVFFAQIASELGIKHVATAHQADDRAETILYNIMRGCGTGGIASFGAQQQIDALTYIRPLWRISRANIESGLADAQLKYRCDASNLTPCYDRNKVRLQIIPYLEERLGRGIKAALCRLADSLADDQKALSWWAEQIVSKLDINSSDGQISVNCQSLMELPSGVLIRVLKALCQRFGADPRTLSRRHLKAFEQLITRGGGTRYLNLPGMQVEVAYMQLTIAQPAAKQLTTKLWELAFPEQDGQYLLPNEERSMLERKSARGETRPGYNTIYLRKAALQPGLMIRNRRPGDRFRPPGHGSSSSLKRFLISQHVPRQMRDKLVLVAQAERVLAIMGENCWVDPDYVAQNGSLTTCLFVFN